MDSGKPCQGFRTDNSLLPSQCGEKADGVAKPSLKSQKWLMGNSSWETSIIGGKNKGFPQC